jgi:hypothetical protein
MEDALLSKYANKTKRAWYFPDTNEKICAKCGAKKSVELFFRHCSTQDGWHSWCKDCCKEGNRKSLEKRYSCFDNRVKSMMRSCEHSSQKRGHKCEITIEDLKNAWAQQGGICVYTGWEMTTQPNRSNTVSVERIDSSIGYTAENTVLACRAVNSMKSDLDGQAFYEICKAVVDHLGDESGNLAVEFKK